MRIIGIILVLIGALSLAYETFRTESDKANKNVAAVGDQTLRIPTLAAGITLVSGLILTAVASRSKED